MSRFESLEFDDKRRAARPAGSGPAQATGTPVRDAAYFRHAADRASRAMRFELALQNYSKALEQDSAAFECWLGQVKMLIELGEYREAMLWADKALEMFPEHPELLAAKAEAAARSGDLHKAMAYTDNALSKKRVTAFVWLSRGEVLLARRSRMAQGASSVPRRRWRVSTIMVKALACSCWFSFIPCMARPTVSMMPRR